MVYVSEFCGSDIVFANFDCIMSAGKALTQNESDEDEHQDICDEIQLEPEGNEPEDNGSPLPQLQNEDNDRPQIGRQKAVAVVSNVHPPDMIAKLICALKKSSLRVIEDVRSNQKELCLTNYELVENEQLLQSQDPRSKYVPLQTGMTFWRRLLMN